MPELSAAEAVLRLLVAAALGGVIGAERELRERGAGLRTHLLVAVGAALFTIVSAYAWRDFTFSQRGGVIFDPTRIAAQIVTGIGFLGAGAIIRQGLSVRGLTTAATLWAVAAIGMAAGAGYYTAAAVTTAVVVFTLWPLRIAAYRLFSRVRGEQGRLIVDIPHRASAAALLGALEEAGAVTRSLEFDEEEGRRRVAIAVELPGRATPSSLVATLMEREEVLAAEWAE